MSSKNLAYAYSSEKSRNVTEDFFMAIDESRREFLIAVPALLAGPFLPRVAMGAGTLGVIGGQNIPDATIIDCNWVRQATSEIDKRLNEMNRSSPKWLSDQISVARKDYATQSSKLKQQIKSAEKDCTVAKVGAFGGFVGFAASVVAAAAAAGAIPVGTVAVGAAIGVSVLAGVTTFAVQVVISQPDERGAIKFVVWNSNDRVSLVLGASKNALLNRLSVVMGGIAAAVAFGEYDQACGSELGKIKSELLALDGKMKKFVEEESFAIETIRQSLLDQRAVLELVERYSASDCKPKLVPVTHAPTVGPLSRIENVMIQEVNG